MTIETAVQLSKALDTINDAAWEIKKQYMKVYESLSKGDQHQLAKILYDKGENK